MSYGQSSAFGWPLWGALLLTIPIVFVVGALTGHTPNWGILQNPIVLLGSIGLAAMGNLWSLLHVEVLKGKPPTLRIDIAASLFSILVLAVASLLGVLLIGYAFLENFTRR
jgi:ribose/xylose/arabinose/galactoside ABC-type transport system permease subunit